MSFTINFQMIVGLIELNRVLLYFDVNNDIVYGGMLISYNPVKAVVNEGVVFYKYVFKQ